MADPLSIATGVFALLRVCCGITIELNQVRTAIGSVNATIDGLLHDFDSVKLVLESIRITFNDVRNRPLFSATGHISEHWTNIQRSLVDGQATLDQLLRVLQRVNKSAALLDAPRKYLRLKAAWEEIATFRNQIQSDRDFLQLTMQAVIL